MSRRRNTFHLDCSIPLMDTSTTNQPVVATRPVSFWMEATAVFILNNKEGYKTTFTYAYVCRWKSPMRHSLKARRTFVTDEIGDEQKQKAKKLARRQRQSRKKWIDHEKPPANKADDKQTKKPSLNGTG